MLEEKCLPLMLCQKFCVIVLIHVICSYNIIYKGGDLLKWEAYIVSKRWGRAGWVGANVLKCVLDIIFIKRYYNIYTLLNLIIFL